MNGEQNNLSIALLGAGQSIHTVRLAKALVGRGSRVTLFTMVAPLGGLSAQIDARRLPVTSRWGYFLNAPSLRRALRRLRPQIFHAHYAGGFGTLGRLVGYHPYVLSVWGSDVYEVPDYSAWHRATIVKNIAAADWICSTSHAMARHIESLGITPDHLSVTPFGIDVDKFNVDSTKRQSGQRDGTITIGTVKTLIPTYGIDTLIEGFAACRQQIQQSDSQLAGRLRLRIVGDGDDRVKLEQLAGELSVADVTTFVGKVPHGEVATELKKLDIFVAVSRSESFGVSVLEASACRLPVIVSNAGGLPEVVHDGETGLIVPSENSHALATALTRLVEEQPLATRLGENGRRHVLEHFEWNHNVAQMEAVYRQVLAASKSNLDSMNRTTTAQPVAVR